MDALPETLGGGWGLEDARGMAGVPTCVEVGADSVGQAQGQWRGQHGP